MTTECRATTTAAADNHRHAVADTGTYGIITLCGQIGSTPMKADDFDCPYCAEVAERDVAGVWMGSEPPLVWVVPTQ